MGECAILHSDMNSFYASVEMMLDPSLKGKAIAVCGSVEERQEIVLAKSNLAKKAGVKTGMVSWQAKQVCPDLILVPPQYDEYLKYSKGAKARATRNLMNLLDEKGISNQKLAKAAQISASTVTNAVRGDPICIESAEKIANVLDCEVRDLFRNASTGKTLAPKTVLEYHRLISTILHQAEKEMILMYNPAARATPPKAKAPTPDYYQPDQMDEILNALENAPLLWKTITYIMIDSGCRRGEALGLKWSSLELDTGLMVIENNLQYTKKTGIYLGPTKTGKVRALKLAPQCVELLKEWKLEQIRIRLKKGADWKVTGMVFTKDNVE